MHSGANYIEDG